MDRDAMVLRGKERDILISNGGDDQSRIFAALITLRRALESGRDEPIGTKFGDNTERWAIRCERVMKRQEEGE